MALSEHDKAAATSVEPTIYYLSFADTARPEGTQWLGGCYVEADNVPNAITAAWVHGCNPGGEVKLARLDPEQARQVPPEQIGVLLSRDDLGETETWQ